MMPTSFTGAPIAATPAWMKGGERLGQQHHGAEGEEQQDGGERGDAPGRRGRVRLLRGVVAGRQEVVAVAHGLHEQEDGVEGEADGADEAELERGVERPGRAGGVVRQHQHQRRHRDQHGEVGLRAVGREFLLAVAQRADDDAGARQAVQHQHQHRVHRIAREVGLGSPLSMIETISATSMTVTARARTSVP
jgi:hypothetical protein